jgi:hypothetical protein
VCMHIYISMHTHIHTYTNQVSGIKRDAPQPQQKLPRSNTFYKARTYMYVYISCVYTGQHYQTRAVSFTTKTTKMHHLLHSTHIYADIHTYIHTSGQRYPAGGAPTTTKMTKMHHRHPSGVHAKPTLTQQQHKTHTSAPHQHVNLYIKGTRRDQTQTQNLERIIRLGPLGGVTQSVRLSTWLSSCLKRSFGSSSRS